MKKYFVSAAARLQHSVVLLCLMALLGACDEDGKCIKGQGSTETRTLTLDPFTKIETNGDFKVYLTEGATQLVQVKGEPNILDQLRTNIKDNTWKIENRECVRRSETVEVYITMPLLHSASLNGSGQIVSQNEFTCTELPVSVNGSGKIALQIDAAQVMTRITGSGVVELSGKSILHNVVISGSGKAEAFDLGANNVTVTMSGSGVAEVSAANLLTADISGSGTVYYKGNPSVNSNITGSGKVVKR